MWRVLNKYGVIIAVFDDLTDAQELADKVGGKVELIIKFDKEKRI